MAAFYSKANARFSRSIIRDLLFEIRILTRINPALGVEAELSLLDLAEV